MAHLFPFAVLPMDIKAADMKLSRPFLYRAVMMAACMLDGARHTRMGHELLADIVKATMMEAARGLDILQGMQALIAW